MEIKNAVMDVLKTSRLARNNDIECIYLTLKKLDMPTDIKELRDLNGNIFETIRRQRQKLQENIPFLAADENTRRNRKRKEEDVKEKVKRSIL